MYMYVLQQNGRHSEEMDREDTCRYLKMEERKFEAHVIGADYGVKERMQKFYSEMPHHSAC